MHPDAEKVKERFGETVLDYHDFRNQATLTVDPEGVFEIMKFLRDESGFEYLVDVTSVDYEDTKPLGRFAVVYHLCRMATGKRLRLKAFLPAEDPVVDSVTSLWKAADWAEREVYDLMGITFRNHPDLRRIMLPDSFEDHPLRKEYPVQGRGERDSFIPYDPKDGI